VTNLARIEFEKNGGRFVIERYAGTGGWCRLIIERDEKRIELGFDADGEDYDFIRAIRDAMVTAFPDDPVESGAPASALPNCPNPMNKDCACPACLDAQREDEPIP
jgi:hypothetical protein